MKDTFKSLYNEIKNNSLMTILLSSIVILFIIIFIGSSNFENALKYTSQISTVIISVVTLAIALTLYDKYGANSKLVHDRMDLVINLLIEIKKMYFREHITVSGEIKLLSLFIPSNNPDRFKLLEDPNILDSEVLFNFDEIGYCFDAILKIKNHPLIPKEIFKKLDFFDFVGGEIINSVEKGNYAKIYFTKNGHKDIKTKDKWVRTNNCKCSLKEYHHKYNLVLDEIENWLKKNSNSKDILNLNVDWTVKLKE